MKSNKLIGIGMLVGFAVTVSFYFFVICVAIFFITPILEPVYLEAKEYWSNKDAIHSPNDCPVDGDCGR